MPRGLTLSRMTFASIIYAPGFWCLSLRRFRSLCLVAAAAHRTLVAGVDELLPRHPSMRAMEAPVPDHSAGHEQRDRLDRDEAAILLLVTFEDNSMRRGGV